MRPVVWPQVCHEARDVTLDKFSAIVKAAISIWASNTAAGGGPKELPRVDIVFRLRQCDKKNHSWREGRRWFSLCQDCSGDRPSPSWCIHCRTKKENCFRWVSGHPPYGLAGI